MLALIGSIREFKGTHSTLNGFFLRPVALDQENHEGDMNARLLSLILFTILMLETNTCLAGETTITGTASCVMPELFEFKTQAITLSQSETLQAPQPPVPSGASGNYEVQKEEKLIQTEKSALIRNDSGADTTVTVYTVCAK